MFPRHRPERGGTLRNHGFWEEQEIKRPGHSSAPRHDTDSHQLQRSASIASDNIVRWNTAKDVLRQTEAETLDAGSRLPSSRGQSQQGSSIPSIHVEAWDMATHPVPLDSDRRPFQAIPTAESDSTRTPSVDLEMIEAKKETRRLRRNLKQSGDYLGVQGINPATGQLDVITPTDSDQSSLSQETRQKVLVLQKTLKDARHSYKSAKEKSQQEARNLVLRSEKEKLRQSELDKVVVKAISQDIKWRRHTRQWSSAQEPGLSPIAQSQSSTAQTSRRPSRPMAEPRVQINIEPQLIDFGKAPGTSSEQIDTLWHDIRYREGSNIETPGSTATVVKTPNRGSLAKLTPSAWELFENGISFDNSRATAPQANHQKDARVNVGSKEKQKDLAPIDTTHGTSERHSESRSESFLDRRGVVQNDSPEVASSLPQHPTARREDSSTHTARPRRSLHFMQWRSSGESEQYQSREQSAGHHPPRWVVRSDAQRQSLPWGRTAKKALQEPSQFLNRKLVPHINEWILKRKSGNTKFTTYKDDPPVTEHQSCTNLVGMPPDAMDQKQRLCPPRLDGHVPELRVVPDMENQRGRLAPKPPFPANVDLNCNVRNLVSPDWAASTTREVMATCTAASGYASIPITTTTGSDRRRGINQTESAPKATAVSDGKHARKSNFDLLAAATSARNLGGHAMKMSQKPLPRMDAEDFSDGPGSTSMHHKADALGKRVKPPRVDPYPAARLGPLPSLTSTQQQGGQTGAAVTASMDTVGTVGAVASTQYKPSQRPGATKTDATKIYVDELSALVTCAGAYPCASQQPCTGGIGENCAYRDIASGGMDDILELTKGTWHKTRCHCLALFWLYWEVVGPVFNSGSEYWIRNGRHEATWTDGAVIVLALPGAIIATTVLV